MDTVVLIAGIAIVWTVVAISLGLVIGRVVRRRDDEESHELRVAQDSGRLGLLFPSR